MSRIAVIGSGFSGISASAYLSAAGHEVHVFEKNSELGGRARQLKTMNGYTFDMGPSWYWMPDVFERFFNDFGHKASDFYQLKLLNPAFDLIFGEHDVLSIPESFSQLCNLFESVETGGSVKLKTFLTEAEYKYKTGIENLVYKPGLSISEFADTDFLKGLLRLQVFTSLSSHVRKYFKDPRLISLMEFPVLFLGASPQDTPALYSLMNYAALKLGTWYPEGGFGGVTGGMIRLSKNYGTCFHASSTVEEIIIENSKVSRLIINGKHFTCDAVVAAADYHHVENKLLPKTFRNYDETYWENKTFAPSCLIFYLGISKKIKRLQHHTLFFDEKLESHSKDIYTNPQWPRKPLFYVCCPSKTDDGVAPSGHENLFILMPVAPGLDDNEELREKYFKLLLQRLEKFTGENVSDYIDYKKGYCINDFILDYNSYKGNAYGLANTLTQTAILKPKIRNRKVSNLYYAGQLTVPGPGVPPAIISGKIAAEQLLKSFKNTPHEIAI